MTTILDLVKNKIESLSDSELVDAIGLAKANSAVALAREKALALELKCRYPDGGSPSGVLFDASVALHPGRETLDIEYVRSHMHPNTFRHALVRGEPFLAVKVVAKKKEAA
jgi:hypothetical protein